MFRKLILAASRLSTISPARAIKERMDQQERDRHRQRERVLFIAIEMLADSISAFSAGLTCATAVNAGSDRRSCPASPPA